MNQETSIMPATNVPETTNKEALTIQRGEVVSATSSLATEQADAILWLFDHAKSKNMSLPEVAAKIDYNANTLYKIFRGLHEAGKANAVSAINKYRRLCEERAGIQRVRFVETKLSKRIWQICELARQHQKPAFIFGASQIGKTEAIGEYQRRRGDTYILRMPSSPSLWSFIHDLCGVLGVTGKTADARREGIKTVLKENDLLIIDEAHQVAMTEKKLTPSSAKVLEFIREIHDVVHCGVVIVATEVFEKDILSGEISGIMQQLVRRSIVTAKIPSTPSKEDLAIFAKSYGLEPASGEYEQMQTRVVQECALGVWLTLLRIGSGIAARQKVAMTWDHVVLAKSERDALEGKAR